MRIFLKRGIPALCIFDEAAVTGSSVCVDLEAWFLLIHLVGHFLDCVCVENGDVGDILTYCIWGAKSSRCHVNQE